MSYLIGIIGALLGFLFFTNSKKNSAESLLSNEKTKETLNPLTQAQAQNQGLIQAEEQKQADIKASEEAEKAKVVTNEDILNYFNKPKSN